MAFGVLPALAPGLVLGFAWRLRSLSLGAELRAVFLQESATQGARLSTSAYAVGATACVHRWWLSGCAVVTVGALIAERLPLGITDQVPWVAAGARVAIELPIVSGLRVRLRSEVLANIVRSVAEIDGGAQAWSQDLVGHTHGGEIVLSW